MIVPAPRFSATRLDAVPLLFSAARTAALGGASVTAGDDLAEVVDDRVVGSRILAPQVQEGDRQSSVRNSDLNA